MLARDTAMKKTLNFYFLKSILQYFYNIYIKGNILTEVNLK